MNREGNDFSRAAKGGRRKCGFGRCARTLYTIGRNTLNSRLRSLPKGAVPRGAKLGSPRRGRGGLGGAALQRCDTILLSLAASAAEGCSSFWPSSQAPQPWEHAHPVILSVWVFSREVCCLGWTQQKRKSAISNRKSSIQVPTPPPTTYDGSWPRRSRTGGSYTTAPCS